MDRKKTTQEVLPFVGLKHQLLINYLGRHPELRPAERLPSDDYLWSDEEIDRLIEARTKPRPIKAVDGRRGPRKKK